MFTKKKSCGVRLFVEMRCFHAYDKRCFQNTLAVVFLIRPVVHSASLLSEDCRPFNPGTDGRGYLFSRQR